jgi:aspartyl-tRNA(Asn)/glutamyl-tRNA(Gln) amidotransferase subunit A
METVRTAKLHLTAGGTSSRALTEASLARATDPHGQGKLVFTRLFVEQARSAAEAVDKMFAAGIDLSALAGLPISVKDLFDIRNEVTTAGAAALRQFPPAPADATAIVRLKRAGAVILGKTNMTEFAYSGVGINQNYGTPANPYDSQARLIPGGSSSGGAISVAEGMALAAVVSDTGGSARIPAALCGLTGFKPTQKRIPLDGVFPLSPSLDSIGTIAQTVDCCAIVDEVLAAGEPEELTPPKLSTLTFTVPQNYVLDGLDAHVAQAFDLALEKLSAAGATIEEARFPEFDEIALVNAKGGFAAAESFAFHKRLRADFGAYDPLVLERILAGQSITAAEYLDLREARVSIISRFRIAHPRADWILCPTVPIVAPPIERLQSDPEEYRRVNRLLLRNPSIANFLDLCSLTLPCHQSGEAPVGLMLIGRTGQDRSLLSTGLAIEAILLPKAK